VIGVQAGVQARRRFLICAAACGVFGGLYAASGTYQSEMAEWRKHREAALLADGGWLTVTGLFWLHEGANRFGSEAVNEIVLPNDPALKGGGAFDLDHGKVVLRMDGQSRELHADSMESRDVVTLGSLSLFVIRRGDRYGIRLKDRNSRLRKEFTGLRYFPVTESYRVSARFVPEARKIPIPNILGQTEDMPSPGYVEFDLEGRKLRLTPVEESPNELFFIFRDLTSGRETYGSGRFLHTAMPKDGKVELDFNKAYNPPCAFTPYATCPLPPKENRLPVRIEAGEFKYGAH
jgi:uncharacterized protein (DUF1684 family)